MLSYQHGFHAGNHADVLKHSVLCHVIDYLLQKDKPFLFFDTHAGRGFYDLQHPMAQKTGEYRDGIARLSPAADAPAGLQPYLSALKTFNQGGGLRYYAGSSLLAARMMRDIDRVVACELHPQEYLALRDNCEGARSMASRCDVRVQKEDGYRALKAALPPKERRGAMLIDPSYELLSDDQAVVACLHEALKRFATGIYMVWYPIVDPRRSQKMLKAAAGLPAAQILQLELMVREPVAATAGMAGSGMLVVNPPWQLAAAMQELLPWLVQQLAPDSGSSRVQWLVGE